MRYVDTDLVLLRRFTEKGDQQAFSEIVQRYAGMVFAVCRRILNDRARAEDVSQETFFRLMTRPESVSQSLGGWLHRAATRLAVDERRSETSRRRREGCVARELPEVSEGQEEARWSDISPHMDEALARLPDRSRLLLIGHFLEGKQQQELARAAGVSAATISRRIKLAADELRRELRRRGVDVMPAALMALSLRHAIELPPPSLQMAAGKMAILSSGRAVAGRSLYAISRRLGAAVHASTEARWAAAALLLAGLISVAVTLNLRFDMLGRLMRPGLTSGDATSETAILGDEPLVSRKVRIAKPNDLDSRHVVSFQQSAAGGRLMYTLTYGDDHVQVTSAREARQLIEKQTGKTVETLENEAYGHSPETR